MAQKILLQYTLTRPGQKPEPRGGSIEGSPMPRDLEQLTALLEHPWGPDAKVTNVRAVDAKGKELAPEQVPAFFKSPEADPAAESPAVVATPAEPPQPQ